MEVRLAALADYANISQEGKLNIMGIFGEINPPVLPFALPSMFLIVTFIAPPAEVGMDKAVRIALLDADSKEKLRLEQSMKVPAPRRPGTTAEINMVIGLNGVRFEGAGDYEFSIMVGGEQKRSLPFRVNEPQPASPDENMGGT